LRFDCARHPAQYPEAVPKRAAKAVKTIFLCRYHHNEDLRREINEGLNVIEPWNSANDFIFFARRGEMVSNRREDHEISMLALHLLQNCMVYINTLMLQQVLAQPHWSGQERAHDQALRSPQRSGHARPGRAHRSVIQGSY
jgi:TnpA family transposase